MDRRVLLNAIVAALLAAGCATATLSLSQAERKAIRIEAVKIDTSEAEIWWGAAEREYLAKVQADPALLAKAKTDKKVKEAKDSADEAQEIMASAEAKAFLKEKLTGMVRKELEERVKPKFTGNRPVVLEIKVKAFTIPSMVQRVVIGGTPMFGAFAYLKDARTGAELGKLDRMASAYAANGVLAVVVDQALEDVEVRIVRNYADNVLNWLTPQS